MKNCRLPLFSAIAGLVLLALTLWGLQGATAETAWLESAVGSQFTYQGALDDNGVPAAGPYDFRFRLYDAETQGSPVGAEINLEDVVVVDGLFAVGLDFGAVWNGDALYLEIDVRPGAETGAFNTLAPRQAVTPAPYAAFAGGAPWSGVTGVPAGFADNTDNDTTYSAGSGISFSGTTINASGSPIANVVVVALSGGDFTSVSAALSSITDAGATNPYQILVGPGIYAEHVVMKPFVDLVGSGVNTTRIAFPGGGATETVVAADNSEIRDLTIENDGSGSSSFALGVNANGVDTRLTNVSVQTSGGSFNYSIYAQQGTTLTLQHVVSFADEGSSAVGLYLFNSQAAIYNSTVEANDTTNGNGIYMTHGGSNDYTVHVVDSVVQGATTLMRLSSGYDVFVANSQLGGGGTINLNSGAITCVASRNDSYGALTSGCGNLVLAPLTAATASQNVTLPELKGDDQ